ncbi:hypothetical protein JKP88DRAFT_173750 [Tribonema minus]|uniref:EML-like second beta-propeller domain-containing protein n=1 Tax=Tribonema minus TaxID=303371 RepID=A0A835ZFR0_9STRA|nr:hypothetical protein JKP88DRAFT_173750 [Tribonema minus]
MQIKLVLSAQDNAASIWPAINLSSQINRCCLPCVCSYITHLDFGRDGQRTCLQTNSGDYELLFSNAETGAQITSATAVRDCEWETWTCTLGWPVQGIWPKGADGTDVNAVDASADRRLLATADDKASAVKIFRYPCVNAHAEAVPAGGHSSHVTNIRWNRNASKLISTGRRDGCIMQWTVTNS